jgi:hypothetical protein
MSILLSRENYIKYIVPMEEEKLIFIKTKRTGGGLSPFISNGK